MSTPRECNICVTIPSKTVWLRLSHLMAIAFSSRGSRTLSSARVDAALTTAVVKSEPSTPEAVLPLADEGFFLRLGVAEGGLSDRVEVDSTLAPDVYAGCTILDAFCSRSVSLTICPSPLVLL